MFKHAAGEDLIDQLHYMADQGFRSFEDNGMKDRPVEEQEAIAKVLQERGMTMGVFVAHKIYWKEPNLASGDPEKLEEFLTHIRESVPWPQRVKCKVDHCCARTYRP